MSAATAGTGFAFYCDDFRPAPRDPLTCELCGHLESEHPVLAGDVAPADLLEPVLVTTSEEWRENMIARCDAIADRIRATCAKLDAIDVAVSDVKRRAGIP